MLILRRGKRKGGNSGDIEFTICQQGITQPRCCFILIQRNQIKMASAWRRIFLIRIFGLRNFFTGIFGSKNFFTGIFGSGNFFTGIFGSGNFFMGIFGFGNFFLWET